MKIAIIGVGVMGAAFAKSLASMHELILCDHKERDELAQWGRFVAHPKKAVEQADFVILAIKPKDLDDLASEMGDVSDKVILSILAGTDVTALNRAFPEAQMVRCMPNLALTQQESVIAVVDDGDLSSEAKELVSEVCEPLGLLYWAEEREIDGITALAGSGPAFVMGVFEAMVESGVMMGLKASDARVLSLQTIKGALALIEAYEGHPGQIRWQICSPAGTTIAGMKAFEDASVRAGLMNTFLAAYKRSKEIK